MVITGAGPGIMEAGIEGAGPEHAFGVSIRLPFEATDEPVHRRRPEAHQLPLLLHPQARVHQGVGRVRAAARRLRHARRGVRAAHARADGQGAAGADRAARRPRRHLLADVARLRRRDELRATRLRRRARPALRAASPTTSTPRSTRSSASTRNYHSLRFVERPARAAHAARCRSTPSSRRSSDEFADIVVRGAHRTYRRAPAEIARRRPRRPRRASRSAFDRHGWARLRSSSTASTDARRTSSEPTVAPG